MSGTKPKYLFLPKDQWSARFDSTFYTVKIEGKQRLTAPPDKSVPASIGGKTNFPAWYYRVVVYREHGKEEHLRRYSHFQWLYEQLIANPSSDEQLSGLNEITFPGSCPMTIQNDAFAQGRMEVLADFLNDVLSRPGYASHPAVLTFLDIDQ